MRKSNLTDEDRNEIANIACDLETGNFLIRPRKLSYRVLMHYIAEILDRGPDEDNPLEQEIVDYFNACGSRDAMKEYEELYNINQTV